MISLSPGVEKFIKVEYVVLSDTMICSAVTTMKQVPNFVVSSWSERQRTLSFCGNANAVLAKNGRS